MDANTWILKINKYMEQEKKEKKIPDGKIKVTLVELLDFCNRYGLTWGNKKEFIQYSPKYFDIRTFPEDKTVFACEHMEIIYVLRKQEHPFELYELGSIFYPSNAYMASEGNLTVLTRSAIYDGETKTKEATWAYPGPEAINGFCQLGILERIELNCDQYNQLQIGLFNQEVDI